ncbi:MAG: hypothetical protein AB8H03_04125 [Saprospiraceae bacterium]
MEIIISIKDERILDQISHKIIPLIPKNGKLSYDDLVNKYKTTVEPDFDLDKIIEKQNYKGLNSQKLDELIEEIKIEESLEDLLEMIEQYHPQCKTVNSI